MAKDDKPTNPLLTVAGQVTEEHLAEVEQQIADKEKELAGLRQLYKLGMALLGKAPPRGGSRKPREGGGRADRVPFDLDTKRREVVVHLSKTGPKQSGDIIRDCRVGPPKINEVLNCPWFNRTAQGWHVTPLARQQVLDD